MNQPRIRELMEGNRIACFFLIEQVTKKAKKSDESYLAFTFKDQNGKISGNYWTPSRTELSRFSSGDLVYVEADVTSYQDRLQLTVNKIRLAAPEDGVSAQDLTKSSPVPGEVLYQNVISYIDNYVKNEDMKLLTLAIYTDFKEKIEKFPAAISFHHAELGGLLNHTSCIMRDCYSISKIYPYLNGDLLLCGAALHDIGKLFEYVEHPNGLLKELSVDGALFTHIYRGAMLIEEYGKILNTDPEVVRLLGHMILSHHGQPEFGSPVTPRFPEAVVLHAMDDLDAKLYEMEDVLGKTQEGCLSDKVNAFDGARLYRSPMFTIGDQYL